MAMFSNFLIYTLTISGLISASSSLPTYRFRGPMKQKITHLHLYWHDIHSGSAPTSVPVVNSPPNMTFGFGAIYMIDDPLTLGLKLSSKEVGRAQGFYALTSQEELSLSMTMSFVLTYGKYNGSTITILGRNPVNMPVREMPVIGGTGLFRFARGYAKIQTLILDQNTGDAVVEYNITVMHY